MGPLFIRQLPLPVLTVVMVVIACARRAFESFLLLLPGRPAARPTGHLRPERASLARREPLTGE